MDKLLVRKDVYEELLEKGFGKRDLSKLTKKQITDKNGHKRTVYVRNGEQPVTQKQPTAQKELSPEKRARYEEMLEKVKAGPNENALFIGSKGMLNKKDAIAYLEKKLGKKSSGNTAQKMANVEDKAFAESEKDAQKKYGNMSIEELKAEAKKYDGVSKYSPEAVEARKVYDILNQKLEEEKKENYLDAKNEGGKDIAENNKIQKLSDKIEFTPDEMKMIRETAKEIGYRVGRDEGYLLNTINSKDKAMYSALTKKNQKVWDESGKKQKTFSQTDLLKEKIESMNGDFGSDDSNSKFDEEMETTKPQINNYEDAHKYLTKLKPSSSELKNDFEDHRDIVLKRIERGQNFEDAIKTYEKEMKTSVPHMVERGIMSFEEGNNYIKAWEDLKKQI